MAETPIRAPEDVSRCHSELQPKNLLFVAIWKSRCFASAQHRNRSRMERSESGFREGRRDAKPAK